MDVVLVSSLPDTFLNYIRDGELHGTDIGSTDSLSCPVTESRCDGCHDYLTTLSVMTGDTHFLPLASIPSIFPERSTTDALSYRPSHLVYRVRSRMIFSSRSGS